MSTELLLSNSKIKPYDHQVVGVNALVSSPYFALFDEMGAGKTKQTIDAAQVLFHTGVIDRVVVICPAPVRAVWFDQELGELKKHLWDTTPAVISQYHQKIKGWMSGPKETRYLHWMITNYDYIRDLERLQELGDFCNNRTLLVLDESSAVKNSKAKQTKACLYLRKKSGRVVLLNGTPIANNPGDLFAQGFIMHPSILDCKNFFQFRARYGIKGGYLGKQIVKWINLNDLQNRFKPHVLRRLKIECIDLPPKLPATIMTKELTPKTWKLYKEMRDDLVAWLSESTVSTAPQAVVRALRLAQLTSGFIGGVDQALPDSDTDFTGPTTQEVGSEKLEVFLEWLDEQLQASPNMKLLVWCRFRAELARLHRTVTQNSKYKQISVGTIWGGQKPYFREHALRLLDPRTMPEGPVIVMGTPSSGSMGLNLTGAHTVVYMSNDYSLKTRLQSEDRVHRPGQTQPVSYMDIVATGPQGQKTIDHSIMKILRGKAQLADWTTEAWINELMEE